MLGSSGFGAGVGGQKEFFGQRSGGGAVKRQRELPDVTLGPGTGWNLQRAVGNGGQGTHDRSTPKERRGYGSGKGSSYSRRLEAENASLRKRCEALLEQALGGSEHCDVVFEFVDGDTSLSGHRAVLCAVSEVYEGMFRSGMVEAQEGKIRVPPGITVCSFRGFIEWLYLGRAGEMCARADGRELWVLGEMFDVGSMREWLLDEGIDGSNFGAAYEFGLVPEGVEREGIIESCLAVVQNGGLGVVDEAGLRGVGREAAKGLALARARQKQGWRFGLCVRDAVRVLEAWMRANRTEALIGGNVHWFRETLGELDLLDMPLKMLRDVLGGCQHADAAWIAGKLERKEAVGHEVYKVERICQGIPPGRMALDGEGSEQRMAILDEEEGKVVIINVESGALIAKVGSRGSGIGQFRIPSGIAFSSAGELYVSDSCLNRIQVFDRQGRYVRRFGEHGIDCGVQGMGQEFDGPEGLCFTADDNLVVVDSMNFCVQVLRKDGTQLFKFGSRRLSEGGLGDIVNQCGPLDVCVGPDGSFAVLNEDDSRQVVIFDRDGEYLRRFGSYGRGPGQFCDYLRGIEVGDNGEIMVCDSVRGDVQCFNWEGEFLRSIGPDGDIVAPFQGPSRLGFIVTDAKGRLFVNDYYADVLPREEGYVPSGQMLCLN